MDSRITWKGTPGKSRNNALQLYFSLKKESKIQVAKNITTRIDVVLLCGKNW
jgi:hypothetical protein